MRSRVYRHDAVLFRRHRLVHVLLGMRGSTAVAMRYALRGSQHGPDRVRFVRGDVHCAGQCGRDVRDRRMRFPLQRRLPPLRLVVRRRQRSDIVRDLVHALRRTVERDADV
jgi:hypothetical protein